MDWVSVADDVIHINDDNYEVKVRIDSGIGKKTIFSVVFDDINAILSENCVHIIGLNGNVYRSGHSSFTRVDNSTYQWQIEDTPPGVWKIAFNGLREHYVRIQVLSQTNTSDAIRMDMRNGYNYLSAYLKRGDEYITGAKLTATIDYVNGCRKVVQDFDVNEGLYKTCLVNYKDIRLINVLATTGHTSMRLSLFTDQFVEPFQRQETVVWPCAKHGKMKSRDIVISTLENSTLPLEPICQPMNSNVNDKSIQQSVVQSKAPTPSAHDREMPDSRPDHGLTTQPPSTPIKEMVVKDVIWSSQGLDDISSHFFQTLTQSEVPKTGQLTQDLSESMNTTEEELEFVIVCEETIVFTEFTERAVLFDADIGQNTIFTIKCQNLNDFSVSIISPNGTQVYDTRHTDYELFVDLCECRLKKTESGIWKIWFAVKKNTHKTGTYYANLCVKSQPICPNYCRMECLLNSIIVTSPSLPSPSLNVSIKRGADVIKDVEVVAVVVKPDGSKWKTKLHLKNENFYTTLLSECEEPGLYYINVLAVKGTAFFIRNTFHNAFQRQQTITCLVKNDSIDNEVVLQESASDETATAVVTDSFTSPHLVALEDSIDGFFNPVLHPIQCRTPNRPIISRKRGTIPMARKSKDIFAQMALIEKDYKRIPKRFLSLNEKLDIKGKDNVDVDEGTVGICYESFTVSFCAPFERMVVIDPYVGQNTVFTVESDIIKGLEIYITCPKLIIYKCSPTVLNSRKRLKLPVTEPGVYNIRIVSFEASISSKANLSIVSEPTVSNPLLMNIRVIEARGENPPIIVSEFIKEDDMIIVAEVTAIVTKPNGSQSKLSLTYYDDIHCNYFTDYCGSGAYSVTVTASGRIYYIKGDDCVKEQDFQRYCKSVSFEVKESMPSKPLNDKHLQELSSHLKTDICDEIIAVSAETSSDIISRNSNHSPIETTTEADIPEELVTVCDEIYIISDVDDSFNIQVTIDSDIGRNTSFAFYSGNIDYVFVTVESPEGKTYDSGVDQLVEDLVLQKQELNLELAESGVWNIKVRSLVDKKVRVLVQTQAITAKPIVMKVNLRDPELLSPAFIFAQITRGLEVITNAIVTATVGRPDGSHTKLFLDLYDKVYCNYFTDYCRSGNYSVTVLAKYRGLGANVQRFQRQQSVGPFIINGLKPCLPLHPFQTLRHLSSIQTFDCLPSGAEPPECETGITTNEELITLCDDLISFDDKAVKSLFIDSTVGHNTVFNIESEDVEYISVSIISPENGQEFDSSSKNTLITKDLNSKRIELKLKNTDPGVWKIRLTNIMEKQNLRLIRAKVCVFSQPIVSDPIRMKAVLKEADIVNKSAPKLIVELIKDNEPILNAEVTAVVCTPDNTRKEVNLSFDDKNKVYCKELSEFKDFGRYECHVWANGLPNISVQSPEISNGFVRSQYVGCFTVNSPLPPSVVITEEPLSIEDIINESQEVTELCSEPIDINIDESKDLSSDSEPIDVNIDESKDHSSDSESSDSNDWVIVSDEEKGILNDFYSSIPKWLTDHSLSHFIQLSIENKTSILCDIEECTQFINCLDPKTEEQIESNRQKMFNILQKLMKL